MNNLTRLIPTVFSGWYENNQDHQLARIQAAFNNQNPSSEQVIEMHNMIKTPEHFKALISASGLQVGTATVFMPHGRDCVSWEGFDPDQQTEWCLLNQGTSTYNLITATSAGCYISSEQKHPCLRRELMAGDIIRGQGALDLLNGLEIVIDELPPIAGTLTRFDGNGEVDTPPSLLMIKCFGGFAILLGLYISYRQYLAIQFGYPQT